MYLADKELWQCNLLSRFRYKIAITLGKLEMQINCSVIKILVLGTYMRT